MRALVELSIAAAFTGVLGGGVFGVFAGGVFGVFAGVTIVPALMECLNGIHTNSFAAFRVLL